MTKDEALKMAIEALEMHVPYYVKDRGCEAINACKEALEQPAQEPVAWMYQREDGAGVLNFERNFALIDKGYKETVLYTHPAQQLSDDEIESILNNSVYCEVDAKPFARAIEAKLKEKNRS